VPSSGPGTFSAAQFSAGCTTNISGFDLRQTQVCKHYLETEGIPLPNKQTIAPLWTEVAKNLGLSPGQMADDDLKQILSGLFSIAAGVGALRTHEGSAHGHGNKKPTRLKPDMLGLPSMPRTR